MTYIAGCFACETLCSQRRASSMALAEAGTLVMQFAVRSTCSRTADIQRRSKCCILLSWHRTGCANHHPKRRQRRITQHITKQTAQIPMPPKQGDSGTAGKTETMVTHVCVHLSDAMVFSASDREWLQAPWFVTSPHRIHTHIPNEIAQLRYILNGADCQGGCLWEREGAVCSFLRTAPPGVQQAHDVRLRPMAKAQSCIWR